jgi:hypothetical protein
VGEVRRSKAEELIIDPWSIEDDAFNCPFVGIIFFISEQFLAALLISAIV